MIHHSRATFKNAERGGPDGEEGVAELLNAMPVACAVTDSSRNLIDVNTAAKKLLGEITEKSLREIFTTALRDGSPAWASVKSKTGPELHLEIWSSKLPVSAGTFEYLHVIHDAGEKKFLEAALLVAADREQQRIGQELHDHLCQHLLGAAFAAKALAGSLEREQSAQAPELHKLARLINDAVFQTRDISRSLHPDELDASGFISALKEIARRAAANSHCEFHSEDGIIILTPSRAIHACRIAAEVVNDAMRSRGARKIDIALFRSGEKICLKITDDGKKPGELCASPPGIAARILQYRAQAMSGTLTIGFSPDQGATTTCIFPP